MTALYVLMGFIYALIGIPMIIFGSDQVRIIGIIYRNRSPTGSENWRS
jgi:hypothetical protein